MDDARLRDAGYSIGFAVHGTALTVKKATASLHSPSDSGRRLTSRDHAHLFRDEYGRWPTAPELRDLAGVTWASANEMVERLRGEAA